MGDSTANQITGQPGNSTARPDGPYDVAIVGGGLVGASLAIALSQLGLQVALLEAVQPKAASKPSFDDRTLALSASSCAILTALRIWPALQANATRIRQVHVSEMGQPGQVVLRSSELGLDQFGHVVEARVFGAAIMEKVSEQPGLDFICPARFVSLLPHDDFVDVVYSADESEKQLKTRLLIGADGADSPVREALGIKAERHDYQQTAVICNVSPAEPHAGRAWEKFTPSGPFALLPHVNDRCGLVWCVETNSAAGLMALNDAEFLQAAEARFGNALGPWHKVGKRSSYPLKLVRARQDAAPRCLLLGNASHAIHPVGAQGFNLGLRDVAVLAELLADAALNHPSGDDVPRRYTADPGQEKILSAYSAWRTPDHASTIAYSDGLARLYSNPTMIAATARRAGLLAHALIPSLRRQLAVRAMGFRGKIPRLALGEKLTA